MKSKTDFATLLLVVATFLVVFANFLLLNQQKREEIIQFRAYLSVSDLEIRPSDRSAGESYDFTFIFTLNNGGVTPASLERQNLRSINKDSGDEILAIELDKVDLDFNNKAYIGPGDKKKVKFFLKEKELETISASNNKLLSMETIYLDYSQNKHTLMSNFEVIKTENGFRLSIYNQYEL